MNNTRMSQKEYYHFNMKHWSTAQHRWTWVPHRGVSAVLRANQSYSREPRVWEPPWTELVGLQIPCTRLGEIIKAVCVMPWPTSMHNEIWWNIQFTLTLIFIEHTHIIEFNAEVLETFFVSLSQAIPTLSSFSAFSLLFLSSSYRLRPFCFTHRTTRSTWLISLLSFS